MHALPLQDAPVERIAGQADSRPISSALHTGRDTIASRRNLSILGQAVRDFCELERPLQRDLATFKELFYQFVEGCTLTERRSLAASLATNPNIPRTIIFYFALDQVEVAAPVLLFSPIVNEADIASLARRCSVAHLRILARREDLTPAAANLLKKAGGPTVAEILARNHALQPTPPAEAIQPEQDTARETEQVTRVAAVKPEETPSAERRESHASDGNTRQKLLELAGRGGRLGAARSRDNQEQTLKEKREQIEVGKQLLLLVRTGGVDSFVEGASIHTSISPDIIRAMIDKLDGQSLAVLLKGMGVDSLEASQLFLRLVAPAGRSMEAYTRMRNLYDRLAEERCKMTVRALAGTLKFEQLEAITSDTSRRLREAANERRASFGTERGGAPADQRMAG
ncbi:MAG: DUF2336 domain-containing protein [Rhizobiaceae bacterium]